MIKVSGISTIENLQTIKEVDSILGYSEGYFLVQKSYPLEAKKEIKEQFDLSNREVNRLLSSQKKSGNYSICWFINKEDGSIIGPFKNARLFSDGVAIVNDGQIAIDTNNRVLFTAEEKGLEEIGDFKEDRAVATIFSENLLENYFVYINKDGNKVHKGRYYEKANNYSEGLAIVEKNSHQCTTDKRGSYIYRTKYHFNNNLSEGLISAANNKISKTGYIDRKQNVIIPFIFDEGKPFSEGFAPVKKGGKWGYINKEGNLVIPYIFDEAYGFKNGIAKVEMFVDGENKPAIIDTNGNFVIEPNDKYKTIDICEEFLIINNNSYLNINEMKLNYMAKLTNYSFETLFLFENAQEKNNFITLANKEIEETRKDINLYKEQAYNKLQESIFKLKYKK